MASDLRPYQQRAVDAARAAIARGCRAPLIVAPTGAGKGTLAAWLLAAAAARGHRCAFAVHRGELVRDIAGRLRAAGVQRVAVEMGGETQRDAAALCTVGTVQTFAARAYADPSAALLVLDEAHHATASTYRGLVERHPNAVVVGLTATPQRADRTALGDVFDALVVAATVQELTEGGYLVPARVIAPAQRTHTLAQHPVEAYRAHAAGLRTIVFAASIQHARAIADGFVAAGVPTAVVDSEQPLEQRREALEDFAAHRVGVLCNVGILTEGYDDPSVGCVIVARGVGSPAAWLQIVGRALRPAPGKTEAMVVDLLGSVHEHGLPGDARQWSLEGRPIQLAEGQEAIRQCATCGQVFRASEYREATCPGCGATAAAKPDPRVVRAQLAEVHEARMARLTGQRHLDFLTQAVASNVARGWKPTSAIHTFKATFGRYPTRAERQHAGI